MINLNDFDAKVTQLTGDLLHSKGIETLQVNLGSVCNQACRHCHLEASPKRKERMEWPVMEQVINTANILDCEFIDLTGGAPELNPDFTRFVKALRCEGYRVGVRTNLTVLLEPGMEKMPEFFKEYGVELVASLPCYLEENVNFQRGEGVYEKSIKALKRLNYLGYGQEDNLPLKIVYNPKGAFLPGKQSALEEDYRKNLKNTHGIDITGLLTITNMPIGRFGAELKNKKTEEYYKLLYESFNPENINNLMCRNMLNIDWRGNLYDCDFNLALGLPVNHGAPDKLENFEIYALMNRRIVTGRHCFGCTAGFGSSCQGALN